MTYKNLPLYIADASSIGPFTYLVGNSVSVSYSASVGEKRRLGVGINQSDQMTFGGPLEVSIDVEFYLQSDRAFSYRFLNDVVNGTGLADLWITMGTRVFEKCHINSYDISVKPFEPVVGRARFVSYMPPTSVAPIATGIERNLADDEQMIYGHTCVVSGMGNVMGGDVVSSVQYTRNYAYTPVYGIGSVEPVRYLLNGVTNEMKIDGTGLNSLINFSGQKTSSDTAVLLVNEASVGMAPAGTPFNIVIPSGSVIVKQDFSVQGGDSVTTSATLRHIQV
jgi:hypothetical protein